MAPPSPAPSPAKTDAAAGGAAGARGAAAGVSIVIPMYNSADTIMDAVRSAQAQTLPASEIVVVDDGSTDGSADVIGGCRGVKLVLKENGGTSSAMNAGIAAASCEWIKFLNADDVLYPNCLEDLVSANATLDPTARVIPSMSMQTHFLDGTCWLGGYDCNHMTTFEQGSRHLDHFIGGIPVAIVHKSVYDNVGGYNDRLRFAEDWEFNLRLLILHKYRFWHIPKTVYEYRIRPNSQSSVGMEFRKKTLNDLTHSVLRRLASAERSEYLSALGKYRRNRVFMAGVHDFANRPCGTPVCPSYRNAAHAAAAGLLRRNKPLHALYSGARSARAAGSMRYLQGWVWATLNSRHALVARCRGLHPLDLNAATPLRLPRLPPVPHRAAPHAALYPECPC